MKRPLLILSMISFLFSCGDQKIDTLKARQEMEAREIKRVSEGEIIEKALAIGNEYTKDIGLKQDPTLGLLIDSSTTIDNRVVFLTLKNLQDFSGESKRDLVYNAYTYNIETGLESQSGVQILEGDTILLYTKPAVLQEKTVGLYYIDLTRKEVVLSIKK